MTRRTWLGGWTRALAKPTATVLLLAPTTGCASVSASAKEPAYNRASGETQHDGTVRSEEEKAPASMPAPAPPPPPPPPGEAPKPKPEPASGRDAAPSGAPAAQAVQQEEKRETQYLVYTANVTMAVYQVEQGLVLVERLARDFGGYLSVRKDREITVRVPRARFEAALAAIDRIGDVVHRDIQAEDVTDEYVDTEIRIKNAKAMQARLRQLLERAAVKEALEIEKELHRVTEQLEILEGKLKLLKDKVAYSTITVTFEARGSAVQATRIRLPFPWLSQLGLPSLLSLEESR